MEKETLLTAYGKQAEEWKREAESSFAFGFPVNEMNQDDLLAVIGGLQKAVNAGMKREREMIGIGDKTFLNTYEQYP